MHPTIPRWVRYPKEKNHIPLVTTGVPGRGESLPNPSRFPESGDSS